MEKQFLFLSVLIVYTFYFNAQAQWVQTNMRFAESWGIAVSGDNVFAGTYGGGVYLGTNNGTSWSKVNSGLTNLSVPSLVFIGTNLFAGTNGGGVFLSTDNGTSWTAVNSGLTHTDATSLAVIGTNLFAGTGGGVFLSTNNGTSWTPVNTGLPADNGVSAFAVSGTNLFAGIGAKVFLSTDNGTSWTPVNSYLPDYRSVQSLAVIGTNLFVGTNGDGIFLDTNNGTSWTAVDQGSIGYYVYSFAVVGTNLFAGTDQGVFLGTNNGTSWTAVNSGLESNINSLAFNGTYLFAGVAMTGVWRRPLSEMITGGTDTSGILLSYDNNSPETGVYESSTTPGMILANRLTAPNNAFKIIKLIYYIEGDDSTGTASFCPVVYPGSITFFGMPSNNSIYSGQLYTPVKGWNTIDISSSNITNPNTSCNDFFVGVKYDGKDEPLIGLDTVSNGRAWEYDVNYSKWTQMDNYNPPFPATLYIRAEVSEITGIVDINTKVPKNFSLTQNYPNPFNPSTTIQYDLPKGENVKLKVYDILGREVATLVDDFQAAGSYKVQWNGRNDRGASLASGIYLYSFDAGGYKSVKKMIYLK